MTSSGTSDDQKREAAAALEELPDDQPEDIRAKELAFRRHEQTEEYRLKKQLADAWCDGDWDVWSWTVAINGDRQQGS
jgi:hypothetical protein